MNIILDTHVFLWALAEPEKIKNNHIELITDISNNIFISSISIAEISIKSSIGKLDFNFNIIDLIRDSGFETLSFTVDDAALLKDLPFYHKDPFDRMIIAQSISNGFYILSDDSKFKDYDCKTL